MIVWLNLAAFGALQAVFLWPILAAVFWPSLTGNSVFAAMISGLLSYGMLQWLALPLPLHIHSVVPALLVSLVAMLGCQAWWPVREVLVTTQDKAE